MRAPMTRKPTLADRYRYAFDNLMARGAWALGAWHLLIALGAVVLVSVLIVVLGITPVDQDGEPMSFGALVWSSLMHAIDPGTITGDEDGGPWRAMMMVATVFGILLIGSVVGVLVASVGD